MRGSIYRRGEQYYIVIDEPTASGKRKQKWIKGGKNKHETDRMLTEILNRIEQGTYVTPGKETLADFLKSWLDDYKNQISERSFERYRDIVYRRLIPNLGHIKLTQLKPEQIKKYYTDMINLGLNNNTVRYHHAVLHVALKTAVEYGKLARNPADAAKAPSKAKHGQINTWNDDEVNSFLQAARGSSYYELFFTALFTGMRRSELLALRWQDIDLILGQIHVSRSMHHLRDGRYIFKDTKSEASTRNIALTPSNALLLKSYKDKRFSDSLMIGKPLSENDLVFSHPDGRPLRPNTITNSWRFLCQKAKVKQICLHSARHTHASIMLKKGVHPKIVQERLGHSSIEMTLDIYSAVVPGLQEDAARRFDEIFNPLEKC